MPTPLEQFLIAHPQFLTFVAIALGYGLGICASIHALLSKRDPRSALGWIAVSLSFPGFGALAYVLFGINRIQLRAKSWQPLRNWRSHPANAPDEYRAIDIPALSSVNNDSLKSLTAISGAMSHYPLVNGCALTVLHNGEEAFPRMLEAIHAAKHCVYLSTYIFETNPTGLLFIDALEAATKRGVDVRVLIDGVGLLYSFPTARRILKKRKVRVATFLPLSLSKRSVYLNLRNHRKLLLIDGVWGFTGGMNIGGRHLAAVKTNPRCVVDMHVAVQGPVLEQMEAIFLQDWHFATGEPPHAPQAHVPAAGQAVCRGLATGPNEDFEKLRWILLGALSTAKRAVRIMTPYFIPDAALVAAINTAVLRGVQVDIILPRLNNLPLVHWASRAYLWELLKYGVAIHYQPAPFVHSKLFVVDDFFSLVGSANLDPRSLRLNFEFTLEVYDIATAGHLITHFDRVRSCSHRVTLEEMDARSLPVKLRDSLAKIFSPYL